MECIFRTCTSTQEYLIPFHLVLCGDNKTGCRLWNECRCSIPLCRAIFITLKSYTTEFIAQIPFMRDHPSLSRTLCIYAPVSTREFLQNSYICARCPDQMIGSRPSGPASDPRCISKLAVSSLCSACCGPPCRHLHLKFWIHGCGCGCVYVFRRL